MHPSFVHSLYLDKALVARAIMAALDRSCVCMLSHWDSHLDLALFSSFLQTPIIRTMLQSDLRAEISPHEHADTPRCWLTELLWAILTVEALDYLQAKRKDIPMLTWLTKLPVSLCSKSETCALIKSGLDQVFKEWKQGLSCPLSHSCNPTYCHSSASSCSCACSCVCFCV